MRIYPYLGEQYFVAAEQITTNYGGIDANGKTVNLDQIREEGKKKYLPKTYTFDDGAIVFKAGDKVSEEKIKRLYWAKEVRSQFYRTVGSDKPLESGHADDVLTMVIYNSPMSINLIVNCTDMKRIMVGFILKGQELSLHMNVHRAKYL